MSEIAERAAKWIVGGDTGASSKFLWSVMMGVADGDKWASSPSDGDDLGRCLRLLDLIPEWKPRIGEMSAQSPEWAALVARWNELEALLRLEIGADLPRRSNLPALKTYELMKTILRPVERGIRIDEGMIVRSRR